MQWMLPPAAEAANNGNATNDLSATDRRMEVLPLRACGRNVCGLHACQNVNDASHILHYSVAKAYSCWALYARSNAGSCRS